LPSITNSKMQPMPENLGTYALQHAYPCLCNRFFVDNNFQKLLTMFAIKFCWII